MKNKIYLDNACTSHPKPDVVWKAMKNYQQNIGASPARSGHSLGQAADKVVSETRELLANLFSVTNSNHIVFTQNSTQALNMIIKGFLKKGDHVITTNLEHNSVLRPLEKLKRQGIITYTVIESNLDGIINPQDIEKTIQKNTTLIVANHASNAIGVISPIKKIGQIAKKHNLKFLVDASQTAGLIEINVEKQNIDFLAFTGHKSLYGPSGIGGAYIKDALTLNTVSEGGSGRNSKSLVQPGYMPDKFESGTLNYLGIAGLGAALKQLQLPKITLEKNLKLINKLIKELKKIDKVTLYGTLNLKEKVPVLSFNIKGLFSNRLAGILDEKYNILTRPGLHCAPLIHKTLKTSLNGTLRVSLGVNSSTEQIDYLLKSLREIAKNG
jgi:cysteine desulfurase / selenocysteine lyase